MSIIRCYDRQILNLTHFQTISYAADVIYFHGSGIEYGKAPFSVKFATDAECKREFDLILEYLQTYYARVSSVI